MTDSEEAYVTLFRQLAGHTPATLERDLLSAIAIPGAASHLIAKDGNGAPAILLSVKKENGGLTYPIVLEHLRVLHEVNCRVALGEEVRSDVFTVVSCLSMDAKLQEYFLRIASVFVSALGNTPTTGQVNKALQSLTQLFRGITQPARKATQGLWAELLVIAEATDARGLARAWHPTPEERFDFAAGHERLEIKSASTGRRRHYFRLEQLQGPVGITRCVASLLVERVGSGASCLDLLSSIRGRLADDPSLMLKVESVVATLLGNTVPAALREEFSLEGAKASIAFYDASTVPGSEMTHPAEVEDVRFLTNLDGSPKMSLEAVMEVGPLLRGAIPR